MKPFELFKPSDFPPESENWGRGRWAMFFNEKLNKLINEWPPVVGKLKQIGDKTYWVATQIQNTDATHRARLAFIEPIEKEPCVNHVPMLRSKNVAMPVSADPFGAALMLGCSIVCSKCNRELQANWTEKK